MSQQLPKGPFWLDPQQPTGFPPLHYALEDPNGLLALGGDLSSERILAAYRQGIFPWYSDEQPILWWSPNPRAILHPEQLKIARSLRKTLRKRLYTITLNQCFSEVIDACAAPRGVDEGTWITSEMRQAYVLLHQQGHAHSVECWYEGDLVGGLYGLAIGKVFFGESMFARRSDASKVAFVHWVRQLQRWGFPLIDCQVETEHLQSLGAQLISREVFAGQLAHYCEQSGPQSWQLEASDILLSDILSK